MHVLNSKIYGHEKLKPLSTRLRSVAHPNKKQETRIRITVIQRYTMLGICW